MKLFQEGQPFFKGNLHLHTTRSDGRIAPEAALHIYREHGYDFLAVTDHWQDGLSGFHKNMLLLPGVELDFYLPTQVVHLVCLGISPSFLSGVSRADTPQAAVDAAARDGAITILAHPTWSMNTTELITGLRGVFAAEVYNTVSGTPWNADRADSSAILDVAASCGALKHLIASDDAHFYDGDQCQSYIMLQADALSEEAVLSALLAGRFYASRGPRFHQIEIDGDAVRVACSPVEKIVFYSNMPYVAGRATLGCGLTGATYKRARYEARGLADRYVRCQITDADGRSAWSNYLTFD